jgi:hypothetical protein
MTLAPSGIDQACELRHPMPRDVAGIEDGRIDTAWYQPQAIIAHAVLAADQPGDEATGGDHPRPARHDAVIAPLAPSLVRIGTVIGGDEGHARPPAGEPGGPGRRARPRMHQIDPLAADDLRQQPGIAPDRPGQLRPQR